MIIFILPVRDSCMHVGKHQHYSDAFFIVSDSQKINYYCKKSHAKTHTILFQSYYEISANYICQ